MMCSDRKRTIYEERIDRDRIHFGVRSTWGLNLKKERNQFCHPKSTRATELIIILGPTVTNKNDIIIKNQWMLFSLDIHQRQKRNSLTPFTITLVQSTTREFTYYTQRYKLAHVPLSQVSALRVHRPTLTRKSSHPYLHLNYIN